MAKPWTRNQKLMRIGLVNAGIAALGTWMTKVQIQVKQVRSDIKELKVESAEFDKLRSAVGEIGTLTSDTISIKTNINMSGSNLIYGIPGSVTLDTGTGVILNPTNGSITMNVAVQPVITNLPSGKFPIFVDAHGATNYILVFTNFLPP